MSLNSHLEKENASVTTNTFNDQDAKDAMAQAFNSESSKKSLVPGSVKNLNSKKAARKESTSFTLSPDVKKGISALAKRNGFKTSSAYVEAVFKEIMANND